MPTKIEWVRADDKTPGETWNAMTGCSHAGSPGCDNCYAARLAATRLKHHPNYKGLAVMRNGHPQWTGEVRFNPKELEKPLRWKKPRRIFVVSMGDLFHEDVPSEFIDQVFATMMYGFQHTFLILTKRPDRMLEYFQSIRNNSRGYIHGEFGYLSTTDERISSNRAWEKMRCYYHGKKPSTSIGDATAWPWPLPNLWLGVTVENDDHKDRIETLLQIPAAVYWISHEPALGPIVYPPEFLALGNRAWLVSGGESGPRARPSHPDYFRQDRDQCVDAGVPWFMKQMSGKTTKERHAIPNDLMIREYPDAI